MLGRPSFHKFLLNSVFQKVEGVRIISWFDGVQALFDDERPKLKNKMVKRIILTKSLKETREESQQKFANLVCPSLKLDDSGYVKQDEMMSGDKDSEMARCENKDSVQGHWP